jgi:cell division septal protein FtsQ
MYKSKFQKLSLRIAKRRKIREGFGLFLKIGAPVAVIIGVILLLRANFLQVKNLAVIGVREVSAEQVKADVANYIAGNKFLVIPKSNIFFVNKDQLASVMLKDFTRIEKVDINKQFFDKGIEFTISERTADFLWCLSAQAGCYFMTKSGLVFASSAEALAEAENKVKFYGVLQDNPIMKSFATPEQMQKYINFIGVFQNSKFEISSINVESEDKATAKTNIGDIIFSPQDSDLSLSAQNAILLIKEIITKSPSAKFNYIDTRFGNKMFYKLL